MKINKIQFNNIHSLRGEHEVDFTKEPLLNAGLFAITGPTGSGKSTLLDVICLALFNRIPRFSGSTSQSMVEKMGAILTRNTKECHAIIEYECSKGIYRSKWEISTARTGNLRDYHMEIFKVDTQTLLPLNKREVPSTNEQLIGLSYEQFVRSILLAQGDFAKFLQSSAKDRSSLLEKITGTGIYRELGKMAFDKFRKHGAALQSLTSEQQVYKNQLLDVETLAEFQSLQIQLTAEIKSIKELIETNKKHQETFHEIHQLETEITTLREKLSDNQRQLHSFEIQEGEKLKNHESLSPFSQDLINWQSYEKDKKRFKSEIELLDKQKQNITNRSSEIQKQAFALLQKEVTSENLISALEQLQSEVVAIDEDIKQVRADYNAAHAGTLLLKKWGLEISGAQFYEGHKRYLAAYTECKQQLHAIEAKLITQGIIVTETSAENAETQIQDCIAAIAVERNRNEQLRRVEKINSDLKSLNERAALHPDQIQTLNTEVEKDKKQWELLALKLENQKLKTSLDSLRNELKSGEPCPLCGSIEHPLAQHLPGIENELEILVRKQAELVKLNEKQLITLVQEFNANKLSIEKKQSEHSNEMDRLDELAQELESKMLQFEGIAAELTAEELLPILKQRQNLIQEFQNFSAKWNDISDASRAVAQLQNAYEKGIALKTQKDAIYRGNNIIQDVQVVRDGLNAVALEMESVNTQLKRFTQEFDDINKTQIRLTIDLKKLLLPLGFQHIEDAIAARLTDINYKTLLDQKNNFFQQIALMEQSIKDKSDRQKTIKSTTVAIEPEALALLLEKNNAELLTKTEERNACIRKLLNHQENYEKVNGLQTQIEQAETQGRKWILLNDYIGDATGDKFNRFAQDLTLNQLIILANKRLSHLSDRYQMDKAKEGEEDGLVIEDGHMGNERRSVKTLSGGETFLLSLSLALALSDLAARNVEINSLFIDEGFGTLDPEVLDQTLDTLERLQSEGGKTIGIISHVETLKERISTQIQLVRNGQGFSTLKVV